MTSSAEATFDPRVAAADLGGDSYGELEASGELKAAIDRIARLLGWGAAERGPFDAIVRPGAKVLVKPNWVLHENQGPWGMEPLLTHASIIRGVVEALLRARPSRLTVGDAPIQSCDFDQLLEVTGLGRWGTQLQAMASIFAGIRDFRRTKCVMRGGVREAFEDQLSADHFVLFDLGEESLLEPVTDRCGSFRVTQYDPAQMAKTHTRGRHQYLVARDVIEADVIVNLPKLKTHKKAGLTCALKNLIGINGNKEYLPHHRVGGSGHGGDCYPGTSMIKRSLESAYDQLNRSSSGAARRAWAAGVRLLDRVARLHGDRLGVEGSWSGNDTIWRTCLDLNRILIYGRSDGTLGNTPARRVIHIVDAIIAGQGDGPLAPQPFALGLLLASESAACVDWVGARLLGYDPMRIPMVREAFGRFRWPLCSFNPNAVELLGDLGAGGAERVLAAYHPAKPVIYPIGWLDALSEGHATR